MVELLQRVEFAYDRQLGRPNYATFTHPGNPPRYPPFAMQLPILFMPWDDAHDGVVCFLHPQHAGAELATSELTSDAQSNIGLCRCGVVRYGQYFERRRNGNGSTSCVEARDLALKIMDHQQLEKQHDDVVNEVRVMAALQNPGFASDVTLASPHLMQWAAARDANNEYIAMDLAANGSLVVYANHRLKAYKRFVVQQLVQTTTSLPTIEASVAAFAARAWMQEALYLYAGVMRGLVYMHAHNVCHLDLDPCNVVVDRDNTPRLIDFGSSEIMTSDGFAGGGDRLVKFKPLYVPPEVHAHNHQEAPRSPFLGAAADMWSAGVLLYQLLCLGYPKGHLALICDPTNWRHNVLCHARDGYGECRGTNGCLICFRHIEFPPVIYEIFAGLLMPEHPADRMSAATVERLLAPLVENYDLDFERRCHTILASL